MVNTNNNEMINSIKKYLEHLKNNNIEFNRVFIFGSYAKGNQKEYSDIDLAIISKNWNPSPFEMQGKLFALTWGIDTRIEPHPFNEEDFNSSNMLADEIIKHGIEIDIN